MLTLLFALSLAHDPVDCPPPGMLEGQVDDPRLPPHLAQCVRQAAAAKPEDVGRQWLALRLDIAAEGLAPYRERALDLLRRTEDPDQLLARAEAFVGVDKALGREALTRAMAKASEWLHAVPRAHRVARIGRVDARLDPGEGAVRWAQGLAATGLVGPERDEARAACVPTGADCERPVAYPLAPPRPLTAEDRQPCTNLGHLWAQAAWGRTYTTERDCLGSVVAQLAPGPGREGAVMLLRRLAARHEAPGEVAVIEVALGEALPVAP